MKLALICVALGATAGTLAGLLVDWLYERKHPAALTSAEMDDRLAPYVCP